MTPCIITIPGAYTSTLSRQNALVGKRTQIGWQLGLLRQQRSNQIDSSTRCRCQSTRHELRLSRMFVMGLLLVLGF
jgi:hypothetical protein